MDRGSSRDVVPGKEGRLGDPSTPTRLEVVQEILEVETTVDGGTDRHRLPGVLDLVTGPWVDAPSSVKSSFAPVGDRGGSLTSGVDINNL